MKLLEAVEKAAGWPAHTLRELDAIPLIEESGDVT